MRILKVEPGKAPYAKEMEEGLKAIQREVEGLFQPLSMGDGVILCCNDEGKLNGMQPNRRLGYDIILKIEQCLSLLSYFSLSLTF